MRQTSFFSAPSFKAFNRTEHGGDVRSGKRKLARPFDPRRPLHVTLRSSRAKGELNLLRAKNRKRVNHEISRLAHRFQVRVYNQANSGNHLHLLVRAKSRADFQAFLRSLSGTLARAVTGAKKGLAKGKFWDSLVWTRVVSWGKDFQGVKSYVTLNAMEAAGVTRREWLRPKTTAPPPTSPKKRELRPRA